MIGKLTGKVDSFTDSTLILDVNGVGYLVSASTRTIAALPATGQEVSLLIETFVREDQLKLFGFATAAEKEWFTLVQSVQGVGAKVALAILSTLSSNELVTAISLADKAMVARTPGVGPKVAQRIVTELKDKISAFTGEVGSIANVLTGSADASQLPSSAADAVSALTNLGYINGQAAGAVAKVVADIGKDAKTEKIIRLALKELAR
ncbi:MAG: Holliday junction branch migration protein RuvA [Rhizobiales bacterium]|nr:Holliday junction branch migration protein RuvA [Hyphomicrobiales bacterium]